MLYPSVVYNITTMSHWSENEIQALLEVYPQKGLKPTAELLGRSVNAVRTKASELGCKRRKDIYSDDEIEAIERYYQNGQINKIIERTGRSRKSIHTKAQKLGIKCKGTKANRLYWEKLTQFELGYLVGMLEGEGSIALDKLHRGRHYTPQVKLVTNTDNEIIEYIRRLGEKIGLSPIKTRVRAGKGNHKDCLHIEVRRIENVYPLLKGLLPYLKGSKRRKAELIMEFCQSRLSAYKNQPYRDEEWKLIEEIRLLNNK